MELKIAFLIIVIYVSNVSAFSTNSNASGENLFDTGSKTELQQQQKTITGKVTNSEDGSVVIGATVVVKGTTLGVTTDINGAFTLGVPTDAATLQISFIGFKTVEVPIGSQTVINVAIDPEILQLEDVIVTAFGISRQTKAITYAAQNLTSDELSKGVNLNMVTGLSGRISGISVTTASTGVGAEAKVLMRGNRSINGSSEPLYVVDGIILNGGISNLSSENIESISILKGANAAALYGSRANNGAVIITTKAGKGSPEGVTTNLGFTYTGSSAILLQKNQNTYGQGANGIYSKNATVAWGPVMDGSQVQHWSNDPGYKDYGTTYAFLPQPDNMKDFFKLGNNFVTNMQVNIKSTNSNAAFSYTNTNASGIIETNNLKSHNLNIRFNSEISKKLSLDSKVNVIQQKFENVLATGEGFSNPVRYLYALPRNIRTEDIKHYTFVNPAGLVRQHYWLENDNGSGNPYWTRQNDQNPVGRMRTIAMVSLKDQITNDLSIMGRSAFDKTFTTSETIRHNDTYTTALYGAYTKRSASSYEWNNDVLLNFHKAISLITLDLNAGANHRLYESENVQGTGSNFNIENMFALSNCSTLTATDGYSKKVVQSVYGFGEISYKNAIFLNVTGRNDWSSTLPSANRSYFYPSVGLTVLLSDLITLPSIFTYMKLRGSFAEVGNDTGPYQLSRTASITYGTISFSSTQPNPNLKPERTKSIEAGVDLRILRDKVRFNFTYYKTNTFDQLFSTPVPTASGVSSIFQNGADVQNKGVEITVGAAVVSTGDFEWNIDLNFSKNNSLVLEIAEGFDVLSFGSDFIREYRLVKGRPFGDIYSKGWLKNENGDVIIKSNGLPTITPGMSVLVANYNPDWLGGISTTLRYKDLTFSALIDIRQGGTFISQTEAVTAGYGILDYTEAGRDGSLLFGENIFEKETAVTATIVNGVTTYTPNTVTCTAENFWNNIGGRNTPAGEPFVRDASNIRMREMTLGYNLPKNLVSKTFIKSANVSLVGRNLFFISNKSKYVDSELMQDTDNSSEGREGFALPTTRTLGVSLNIGF